MNPDILLEDEAIAAAFNDSVWTPAQWTSSQLFHWFHGGVPAIGRASTILGGVGNTTTGWQDDSGNSRHVATPAQVTATTGVINGTPDVVKPNQIEGINFARGSAEYMMQNQGPPAYTAASDSDGTVWMLIKVTSGDTENADLIPCGFGASGSGSRAAYQNLYSTGGECTPRVYVQNGTSPSINDATAYVTGGNNNIIPNTVHSIVFEANGTANTYRIWLDGTEKTGANLTTLAQGTGTLGDWWAWVNGGSTLNRFAIGTTPTNSGVNSNYFNGHIYELGERRGVLGSDETNFLAYLAMQKALC